MLLPVTADDGVSLDIRYATANNFTGKPIYARPVALLRPEARTALLAAAARATAIGLRLTIFDAFRPLEAQWALWNALPDPRFVANPADGTGRHPRGIAVDLTFADRATGAELDMGTGFDDMTPQSVHATLDLAPSALRNRALLLGVMTATGWEHIGSEWWHYQLPGGDTLPLLWAKDAPGGPI